MLYQDFQKFVVAIKIPSNLSICQKYILHLIMHLIRTTSSSTTFELKIDLFHLKVKLVLFLFALLSHYIYQKYFVHFFSLSPIYIDRILEQSKLKTSF